MNRWKLSFFVTLLLLVLFAAFSFIRVLDNGKSSQQMKEGYDATEKDMVILIKISNSNLKTRDKIANFLKNEHWDFTSI